MNELTAPQYVEIIQAVSTRMASETARLNIEVAELSARLRAANAELEELRPKAAKRDE